MVHFSENSLIVNLRRLLHFYGLWPGPNANRFYYLYSYCLHVVVSFAYSLFQTINLLMCMNDVDRFTESVYSTLTVIAFFVKLINYMYYQKHIIECLTKLMRMQRNSRSDEIIFHAKLQFLSKLTIVFFFGANCTVLAAALKPLFSTIAVLPIASWYPLDWQHNTRDFWIVFTHDVIGAFIVGQVNLGMDSYAYYLMAMITTQLEVLHINIEELGTNFDQSETDQSHRKIIEKNALSLNLCLREHQMILELVSDVKRYFSLQFFAQICLSGTVLACGVHQLNTVSLLENFFHFAYLLAFMTTVTMQTFLYTYYGHGVLKASDELSKAVYLSKWYKLLPDLGKDLTILMECLKRKCEITAGKLFSMNLSLFQKIMDLSYRLYLFLQSV
ncbi:Odorant receptor 2a [Pseudolycoriella hygida]|uniref:Odorant receptor n=1 Tax=Pseudolycoriella hygida TaxID=35572 RepID=A0A9Q0MHM5_9DIPT|nr:Odorant receptor 2a [Pseudolycoriella hygida]KAJ6635862.1 Odorant receptor 2a [Pseudolycoriella hygida]